MLLYILDCELFSLILFLSGNECECQCEYQCTLYTQWNKFHLWHAIDIKYCIDDGLNGLDIFEISFLLKTIFECKS